jgi:hypothetical protein
MDNETLGGINIPHMVAVLKYMNVLPKGLKVSPKVYAVVSAYIKQAIEQGSQFLPFPNFFACCTSILRAFGRSLYGNEAYYAAGILGNFVLRGPLRWQSTRDPELYRPNSVFSAAMLEPDHQFVADALNGRFGADELRIAMRNLTENLEFTSTVSKLVTKYDNLSSLRAALELKVHNHHDAVITFLVAIWCDMNGLIEFGTENVPFISRNRDRNERERERDRERVREYEPERDNHQLRIRPRPQTPQTTQTPQTHYPSKNNGTNTNPNPTPPARSPNHRRQAPRRRPNHSRLNGEKDLNKLKNDESDGFEVAEVAEGNLPTPMPVKLGEESPIVGIPLEALVLGESSKLGEYV